MGLRGLPDKSVEPHGLIMLTFTTVFRVIFLYVADYIRTTNPSFDAKIEIVKQYDLGYTFLVILFAKIAFDLCNVISLHSRRAPCVNPPDQHVYKIIEQPKKKDDESNYVVLENEGPVGAFNRAQRGVFNYLEVYAAYVAFVLLAGPIFPFPVFVVGIIFAASRVLFSVGYTLALNGRGLGFALSSLSVNFLEGLVTIVALRSFGFELIKLF